MPITDWPVHERPRERLLRSGAGSLTDAELLAVFLRVGVPGRTAVDLAREALAHFGGLRSLLNARLETFSALHGMGAAKYAQLQAALELARRVLQQEIVDAPAFNVSAQVRQFLALKFGQRDVEVFAVLFLDVQHRLLSCDEMFKGTLTQTAVYPREIVKQALAYNAAAVILVHNHPSGHCEPSTADRALTQTLQTALQLVDIRVLDHFIVGATASYSFTEHGLI